MSAKQRRTPGVYVSDLRALPTAVAGVATSIPVFIGYTEKVPETASRPIANLAIGIDSIAQFEERFGARADGDPAGMTPILYESLELFFANGGMRCYIVSVGSFADFAADLEGGAGLRPDRLQAGLRATRMQSGPTLLLAPDALAMAVNDYLEFACSMIWQAARLGDRFAIVDVPGGGDPANDAPDRIAAVIERFRKGIEPAGAAKSYGAAYFPYLVTTAAGGRRRMPASPVIAGTYAASDNLNGVWSAPVDRPLEMIEGVVIAIGDAEQGGMNIPFDGVAVNAVRAFPDRGVVVWGARTFDGGSEDFRYVQVRRTLIYIEQSIKTALAQFAFANNDAPTWAAVTAMVSAFLTDLWAGGALLGAKASDAFIVSCGREATMNGLDILNGILRVRIAVQMIHPAEFVRLELEQKMAVRPQPAL